MLIPFREAFGEPWGSLAAILAVPSLPRPLPRSLLGSLGVPKDLQSTILIEFGPTWSHFGSPGPRFRGPGLHFESPGAPIWRLWGSMLEALGPDFHTSNFLIFPSFYASKLPSLQTSRPPIFQAWRGGMRGAFE